MNTSKPTVVKTAEILLWVTLGVELFYLAHQLFYQLNLTSGTSVSLTANSYLDLISYAFTALLIYQLGKRKNWARWLLTLFFVLQFVQSIFWICLTYLLQTKSARQEMLQGLTGILYLLSFVVQVAAYVLLFSAPARAWYKKQKPLPPSPKGL